MGRRALVTLAIVATFIVTARAEQPWPTLTIVNQSDDNATVKVVGPSHFQVDVSSGSRQTVVVSGGQYELRIRYCSASGCRYTRTNGFLVAERQDRGSRMMVTLRQSGGNLSAKPIAPSDF